MACGLKILTSNEAFKDILPEENFTKNEPKVVAEKIENLAKSPNLTKDKFIDYVSANHGLYNLTKKIRGFLV